MSSAEDSPPLESGVGVGPTRAQKIVALSLAVGAVAFIAVTGGLCISGTINLAGETTHLPTFADRIEFTFKYLFLGVLWLLFLVFLVILYRGKTGSFDPLAGREMHIKKQANILQNSFEQFIISAFAQLCLVAYIDEKYTLRTIPWVNFIFFIGRILFLIGYPNRRTFGILCSLVPSVGMIGVVTYKFFVHLF